MDLNEIFTTKNPTIPRSFRRKKKFPIYFEEQKDPHSSMDKNPFFQSTFIKWEKILGRIPHRSIYFPSEHHKRLAGGSDKNVDDSANKSKRLMTHESTTELNKIRQRESQVSSNRHSSDVSENKVDEIIECAIQNLQEAGKVLASLGENHEHEIKLMVTDVVAKFQKWIDIVQKKLDDTKNDMNSIQRAYAAQNAMLITKDHELTELRAKLAECDDNHAVHDKTLDENPFEAVQHTALRISTASNVVSLTSKPRSSTIEVISYHFPPEAPTVVTVPENPVAPPEISNQSERDNEHATSRSKISFSAQSANHSVTENDQDVLLVDDAETSSTNVTHDSSGSQAYVTHSVEPMPHTGSVVSKLIEPIIQTQETQQHDVISISGQTNSLQPVPEPSRNSTIPVQQRSTYTTNVQPPGINSGTMTNSESPSIISSHIPTAAQEISNKNHDEEHDEQLVELEAELIQLRSENEKMKREHAEYENAIQRALLEGVASLNAETLKVLRNPPLSYHKPCNTCNPPQSSSASDTTATIPCFLQVPKDHVPQRTKKNLLSKVGVVCKIRENNVHSSSRRQATSICYAPAKKSSQSNMVFLLPQQHIDCSCTATVPQYCVDVNYTKATRKYPKERCSSFRGTSIHK